jgi:small conductance mechanosensitive channel
MDTSTWVAHAQQILLTHAVPLVGRIVGAILLWVVGRSAIAAVQRVASRALQHREIDPTLASYVRSMIGISLTLLLVMAILSIFGVETTSLAGVIAAAGVAIGMAWSGLLSNVAAGVFLMVLRPFKVGDVIGAAGIMGVVTEIGLFATTIDTKDNISNFVGNSKILGSNIQNFSTNPSVRMDVKV